MLEGCRYHNSPKQPVGSEDQVFTSEERLTAAKSCAQLYAVDHLDHQVGLSHASLWGSHRVFLINLIFISYKMCWDTPCSKKTGRRSLLIEITLLTGNRYKLIVCGSLWHVKVYGAKVFERTLWQKHAPISRQTSLNLTLSPSPEFYSWESTVKSLVSSAPKNPVAKLDGATNSGRLAAIFPDSGHGYGWRRAWIGAIPLIKEVRFFMLSLLFSYDMWHDQSHSVPPHDGWRLL